MAEMSATKQGRYNWDYLGVCASTICLIHCLALPVVLAALPLLTLPPSDSEAATSEAATTSTASSAASLDHHHAHDHAHHSHAHHNHTGHAHAGHGDAGHAHAHAETSAATSFTENVKFASMFTRCDDHAFHSGMLLLVIPVGLVALVGGYRKHKNLRVLAVGILGCGLLGAAVLFGGTTGNHQAEHVVTILGSLVLVSAHIANQTACRCPKSR